MTSRSASLTSTATTPAAADVAACAELARLVARHTRADGQSDTTVPFVQLLRWSRPTPTRHGVLEPSLCLVVQGGKRIQLGRQSYAYGAGSFVMSALEYPTAGQIAEATVARPYLALRVALPTVELAAVAVEAKLDFARAAVPAGPAAFIGGADAHVLACCARLLRLLDEPPAAAAFLAGGIRRELVYRLLAGPHGPLIYRSVRPAHAGVGRAIDWLRTHFDRPIDIDALAKASRMSVSSLRHEFKATTALAPLQFQKQLRLQEARRLLAAGEADAGTAAFRVGYESPSQFSREYRRLFGAPPIRYVRELRGRALAPEL